MKSKLFKIILLGFLCQFFLLGCAKTQLGKVKELNAAGLTKPDKVLIQPFTFNEKDIEPGSSPISMVSGSSSKRDEILALAKEVNGALVEELSQKVKEMGLTPVVISDGKQPSSSEVLVTGRWTKIDEGSAVKRNMIGFGAGQSLVEGQVVVSGLSSQGPVELITFTAHADSGSKPGAITGPAGAAAGAGTAASVGVSVAKSAATIYQSSSSHEASEIADKIAEELSSYFVKQGWISKAQ